MFNDNILEKMKIREEEIKVPEDHPIVSSQN